MQTAVKMGHNQTGAQMSPKDSEAQVKATQEVRPDVPGGPEKLALVRTEEAARAEPIGTVPVPGSAKGMLKTAVNKLVGVSPEVLIDKLGERLAFERGGVRLYDALLAKAQAIDTLDKSMLQTLRHFREEEAEHLELVKAAIE
ncbi:MAG TPA: ferritin Dps family protein, partial [Pseudomonas sp.]|nr:ferritin Dps family protein [Pseudomonas sp.]